MKRNVLLFIALSFLCTVFLIFSSTHVRDEQAARSTFFTQKIEKRIPKAKVFNPKKFFSQFAP